MSFLVAMFFIARRNIPDNRLAALIHMHVLDAHELRAALAQPPQSLDLRHIRPHQFGCSRQKHRCPPLHGGAFAGGVLLPRNSRSRVRWCRSDVVWPMT